MLGALYTDHWNLGIGLKVWYNHHMKIIYIVRHGEYLNPHHIIPGRLPVVLSKKGITKIKNLAKIFSDKEITHIYSSAVLRCKQTSEIISHNSIPITYDKRLLESFSAYQGYWTRDLKEFFIHQNELGGETQEEVQGRMRSFWDEVIPKTKGNIVICSHGDPIYLLYLSLVGKPIPNVIVLSDTQPDYPEKGTAYEMTIDENNKIKRTAIL